MKTRMTALELILHLAEGSTTPNTLQHITKIAREALAEQPAQQEPVAWGIIASNTGRICQVELDADKVEGHNPKHIVPLYTTPQPPAQPLTKAQIINALAPSMNFTSLDYDEIIEPITRAIEAAHQIGVKKGNT